MDAGTLRQTLALASAFKEGDRSIAGAVDDRVRQEARRALLATTVGEIHATVLIHDRVSDQLQRSRDRRFDAELRSLTIGRLREALLAPGADAWVRTYGPGLGSEAIAAVVKVLTADELSGVSRAVFHPLGDDRIAIGSERHFGSRIQPNSVGDDEQQILFSIFEGLAYGCGDVIIGLNPAADDLATIVRLEQLLEQVVRRLELPTRFCVLSDLVKQHAALGRTRVDVGFQSLAGTSRALVGMVSHDVDGVADLARSFNGLYFETGQGSEITNGAAEGLDMGTLEARTYGLARCLQNATRKWTIVNDVAGFIGPEVFRTAEQLERVCLEDAVMAKMHGLTMGLDVCATFHMGIAPSELRAVTKRVVARGAPAYLMAVAGNADPMLGYMTTSFREHPELKRLAGRQATSAMSRRLEELGVSAAGSKPRMTTRLSALYEKAGGSRRSLASLEEDGLRRLAELQEQGLDLGIPDTARSDARVEAIYLNARAALYAVLDDAVLNDACGRWLPVRTIAGGRDQYLADPAAGERLCDEDARAVSALYPARRPQVQMVVSDGLNANAVNEQLRGLLPALRRALSDDGRHVGDSVVVVRNGRVRAGYEIGGRAGAEVVVHLIGERPGTGLNTLSAYVTYGRDDAGAFRWSRDLPHSATTAVCGIHRKGKPIDAAVAEVSSVVARIFRDRRSGVALESRLRGGERVS
ncbi:MAG TPA: ethanolamine ammonia-lyase subunit EutB [Thermoanaerobaculia bacterium]|nr:ethanolamine ammonia-lyase subunit EutB [Thermoanaerobaculia bacterium]